MQKQTNNKFRVEIDKIENSKIIFETKSWFFKRINEIDPFLARQTKIKRQKTQITNIRNESYYFSFHGY